MIFLVAPMGLLICVFGDAPWWGWMLWLYLMMLSVQSD